MLNNEQRNAIVESLKGMSDNIKLMSLVLLMTSQHANSVKFLQHAALLAALADEMAALVKDMPTNDGVQNTEQANDEKSEENEYDEIRRMLDFL